MSAKDVRKVVRRLNKIPGITVKQGKTHYIVYKDGNRVSAMPVSPSDRRWRQNQRRDLRRLGIPTL